MFAGPALALVVDAKWIIGPMESVGATQPSKAIVVPTRSDHLAAPRTTGLPQSPGDHEMPACELYNAAAPRGHVGRAESPDVDGAHLVGGEGLHGIAFAGQETGEQWIHYRGRPRLSHGVQEMADFRKAATAIARSFCGPELVLMAGFSRCCA